MLGACIGQGQLMTLAMELTRYKLVLNGVQEVRWDKGGTFRAGNFIFFNGKRNENRKLRTVSCTTQNSINS